MSTSDRARAVNAADILNDFVGDYITGVIVLHEYSRVRSGHTLDAFVPDIA